MNAVKKTASTVTLVICGLILLVIGLSITLSPVTFYASSGITLGNDPSLINELRAPAGMLMVSGVILLLGVIIVSLRSYAWLLSTLVYLPYGFARVIGFTAAGVPNESIVLAAVIEIVLGLVSLAMFLKSKKQAPVIESKAALQYAN